MALETTQRYDGEQISESGDHAIVVGGSVAGLLSARVLADAFKTVSIIEKDPLSDEPTVRPGVPQASHIHVMHEAGRKTLEDLFPGYSEELTAAGAHVLDMATDLKFYDEGDFVADGPNRIPMYSASRPLFEQVTRRRTAEIDGVVMRDECQLTEYLVDDKLSTVEGVVIRNENAQREEVGAELVVDATGRTSRTPAWLEDHRYSSPPVYEVHIDVAYSTIRFERTAAVQQAYIVMPSPPRRRGGFAFPIEDGYWLMGLAGMHGDHPPTDLDGLADFAGSLPVPAFERLIEEQDIVSEEVAHYPFPSNRKCCYWDLDRFPDGLVVIGDAIASYNPVYGQGMSVAALEALHLHHVLAEDSEEEIGLRLFDRIETVVEDAWNVAVGTDFRFPETTGPKPPGTDLLNRYFSRFTQKTHTDGELADTYCRVVMMERRPTALLRPRVVWRVLKPTLQRREVAY